MSRVVLMTAHHRADAQIPVFARHFMPIQVGRALSSEDLGITGDDTGVHRSMRNPTYCELTACYWALHHVDSDYIGLMHYRRIFSADSQRVTLLWQRVRMAAGSLVARAGIWPTHMAEYRASSDDLETSCVTLNAFLKQHLGRYDLVLPRPVVLTGQTVSEHFIAHHGQRSWDRASEALRALYPALYPHWRELESSHAFHARNMFVMRRSLFVAYHEMMFRLFDEMELRNADAGDALPPRIFGFLGERLLNAFVSQQGEQGPLAVLELPVISLD